MGFDTLMDRLIWARTRKKMKISQVAHATGINERTLQSYESGHRGSRGLPPKYAQPLARIYGVNQFWLMTGQGEALETRQSQTRRVTVRGALVAGIWREVFDWDAEQMFDVVVPVDRKYAADPIYAAMIAGDSMNAVFPTNSIVVMRRRIEPPADLVAGRRYHVEHHRADGAIESTLKKIEHGGDGSVWLMPESHNPEFKAGTKLTADNLRSISFVGMVIAAVVPYE